MYSPELLYALNLLAVFSFALSGALLGLKRQWDMGAILFLSTACALCGVTLSNALLGTFPVRFLEDIRYSLLCIIATGIVLLFRNNMYRFGRFIQLTDALGAGILFSTSMTIGLSQHFGFLPCIFFGTIIALSGGILRDVLGGEIPLVFRKEMYVVWFLVGGFVYFLLYLFPLERGYIVIAVGLTIFVLRVLSLHQRWIFPRT